MLRKVKRSLQRALWRQRSESVRDRMRVPSFSRSPLAGSASAGQENGGQLRALCRKKRRKPFALAHRSFATSGCEGDATGGLLSHQLRRSSPRSPRKQSGGAERRDAGGPSDVFIPPLCGTQNNRRSKRGGGEDRSGMGDAKEESPKRSRCKMAVRAARPQGPHSVKNRPAANSGGVMEGPPKSDDGCTELGRRDGGVSRAASKTAG